MQLIYFERYHLKIQAQTDNHPEIQRFKRKLTIKKNQQKKIQNHKFIT